MQNKKQLWLLAGGNGAGKSTFYRRFLQDQKIRFINADVIAKQLDSDSPEQKSYEAAAIASRIRSALLNSGKSFCFETVFSHPSKIDFVAQAKALGYEIILVYIHLQSTDLNIGRIAQRVSEGGHAVPDEKVISRIPRTMVNIRTVLPLVDIAQIYDNSSYTNPFVNVAKIEKGILYQQASLLPEWAASILDDYL